MKQKTQIIIDILVGLVCLSIILVMLQTLKKDNEKPTVIQTDYSKYTEIINNQEAIIKNLRHSIDSLNRVLDDIKNQKRVLTREYEKINATVHLYTVSELQQFFSKRYTGDVTATGSPEGGK